MLGISFILIELILGAAAVALAWSHVRRVEAAVSADLRKIAAAVRRAPPHERVAELSRSAPRWGFEVALAASLAACASDDDRVAVMNEALAELDFSLAAGARWPASALKIAVWSTMLLAIAAYLAQIGGPSPPNLASILVIIALGAASAVACLAADRRAARARRDAREAADALVTALFGRLPDARSAPAPPTKRRRRQRAQ